VKRWLKIAVALVLLAPIAAIGTLKISKAQCFSLTGHAICRVETSQPLVALTFDDGPTVQGLDAVLPLLQRYNAKGTFFLIGERVQAPLVRRIVAEGHEVGNHSFNHHRMVFRSSDFYDEEIRRTDATLREAGAPKPTLFRPPFGKKLIGLPLAVERNGYRLIMWDSGDPPDRDPVIYARKVLQTVRPGSIVLMHPMYSANATERAALPLILDGLKKRGYRMVTVSELIAQGEPKAE
jgi:peptidoglycan/xylan/chitin deacetylase (PgdA/CDA1 family)